jgi:hypothetical protein
MLWSMQAALVTLVVEDRALAAAAADAALAASEEARASAASHDQVGDGQPCGVHGCGLRAGCEGSWV